MDTLLALAGIGAPVAVAITAAFAITSRMLRFLQ
jgi:hypothetical protein